MLHVLTNLDSSHHYMHTLVHSVPCAARGLGSATGRRALDNLDRLDQRPSPRTLHLPPRTRLQLHRAGCSTSPRPLRARRARAALAARMMSQRATTASALAADSPRAAVATDPES